VFGLQANLACCAVNHPQDFPKFIANAFVTAGNGSSLLQVYYAPIAVNTTLAGGNAVTVTGNTDYPFADTV
jgi:hypothetical protein